MARKETVTAVALHSQLQTVVDEQIKQLPALLEQMKPVERVNVLLKLLPYVAPKVDAETNPYDGWGPFGV